MYQAALAHLVCPADCTRLHLAADAVFAADGSVEQGQLLCPLCQRQYAIEDGIPNLLLDKARFKSPAQFLNTLSPTAWIYERSWRPRALSLLSGEPFGYERELPLITGLAAAQRGGLLLDVACSNGLYARALERARHRAPGHVIGIDHSRPMLNQARAFARRNRLSISYVQASAQALPVAPASAAALVMGGSLNEIGDVALALGEIRRVLRSDGRCVMMTLVRAEQAPGRLLQTMLAGGGLSFPTLAETNHSFQAAGLRIAAQWRYRLVLFTLLLAAETAAT